MISARIGYRGDTIGQAGCTEKPCRNRLPGMAETLEDLPLWVCTEKQ
jgi:hypothetical protein